MNRKDELNRSIKKLKAKIDRLQERMDALYHQLWETEAELEEYEGYERLEDQGIEY